MPCLGVLMSTAAFVFASALVVAAQIAFALAYGEAGMVQRPDPIEAESERALNDWLRDTVVGDEPVARMFDHGLSARSAGPADRLP